MSKNKKKIQVGSIKLAPNGQNQFEGIVYAHKLNATNEYYVGETTNQDLRLSGWKSKGSSYGGPKINKAREEFGIDDSIWSYAVLETVTADSKEELDAKLKERESYWIKELDSVEHGFNTNYGGRGMSGLALTEEHKKKIGQANSQKVTVLFDDKSTMDFQSQKEAAKQLNMSEASISNYARNGKHNDRGGWKIV